MYCTHCAETIADAAEICPKCGVRQNKVINYCYNCGQSVTDIQEICTACGVNVKKGKPAGNGEAMHPAIPALLSLLLTGLGQIVNGQVAKGILVFVLSIIFSILTLGFSVYITLPIVIIDAYLIAKKRKEGKKVEKFEFF